MKLPLLHDCRQNGEWVRHRAEIDCREVRLNSGQVRFEGTRCDGTPLHAIGRWTRNTVVIDPCSTFDERLMVEGDRAWRSVRFGPWEALVEMPEQDDRSGYDGDLFGGDI